MDTVVNAEPQAIMDRLDGWFGREWTLGGWLSHPNSSTAQITAQKRTLFDSLGGWVVFLGLSLITGGAFAVVYLLYALIFKEKMLVASLIATPEGGRTRVTVQSNYTPFQQELEGWVTREFGGSE